MKDDSSLTEEQQATANREFINFTLDYFRAAKPRKPSCFVCTPCPPPRIRKATWWEKDVPKHPPEDPESEPLTGP